MTTLEGKLYENINKIYSSTSFMDRYGLDVWITIIICVIFFVVSSYFYVMNKLEPIKADWQNQKCNPRVIPFAGLINKDPGVSTFEFTATNFAHCTNRILEHIADTAFKPFFYLLHLLNKIFVEASEALNSLRDLISNLRNRLKSISEYMYQILANMALPIIELYLNIKDILDKVVGTLTATLFTFAGSYLALKSLLIFMFNLIQTKQLF